MNFSKFFSYYLHALSLSMKSALSLRGVFILQALFMAMNNGIFLITWFVFFQKFKSVQGWDIYAMILMYGLVALSVGFVTVFMSGLQSLARIIESGELDTYLLQPKPILLQIAPSECEAYGIGDMITGVIAIGWVGLYSPAQLLGLSLSLLSGVAIFVAFLIMMGTLAFWIADFHEWVRELIINFLILATKPNCVYTGGLRIISFTIIPVAFMSLLPVDFLLYHQWSSLIVMIIGTPALLLLSYKFFELGLRHYESGNRFGVRG